MTPKPALVALLAATGLLGTVNCGKMQGTGLVAGRGGRSPAAGAGGAGDGGGVGGSSGTGGAPYGLPSTISLVVDGAEPLVTSDAAATCLQLFEGFGATVGGFAVEFEAFIQEPGDYAGDPLRILYLHMKAPDGSDYCGTGGLTSCLGSVNLHARAVAPRFSGELEAEVVDRDDPEAPPLAIKLTFDVADRTDCK